MDLAIKGRVALVAGASEGMGRGIALAYAREGVHLALCARSADLLEHVAGEARAMGVRVLARSVDVTNDGDVRTMVEAAEQELGGVDIFVNTVGGSFRIGELMECEDVDFARSYDLNLLSSVRFLRALLPGMKHRRWGRVVLFSSVAGLQVTPAPANRFVEYGTSKAAVIALTKYASEHVAADNVLVNCICPGPILTNRSWASMPEDVVRQRCEMVPMKRLGTIEEAADLTLFLSSERCTYITGTAIPLDGGLSRALP